MNDNLLVPIETYLKYGVYLGTKSKNKYVKKYIHKIRKDGLTIFDIQKIDEAIRKAAKLIAKFKPEEVLIIGRREYSWKAISKFAELNGSKAFPKRYPPGILTNTTLPNFVRAKLAILVDPYLDSNALKDAFDTGLTIISLVDSNNTTNLIDLAIPVNNKGRKSLALVFYLLTREVLKERGIIKDDKEFNLEIEDFLYEI